MRGRKKTGAKKDGAKKDGAEKAGAKKDGGEKSGGGKRPSIPASISPQMFYKLFEIGPFPPMPHLPIVY